MTAQLAEAYTVAGNANNALVIPAGLAFARAIGKLPELNLYAPDKRHPSLAGTYLASCVVFGALTGRSPVGNSYLANIDRRPRHSCRTWRGKPCRNITGSRVSVRCCRAELPAPSLRANGSRECAPDDRLREAIHPCRRKKLDCFVATLPCANASRLSQAMTVTELVVPDESITPCAWPLPSAGPAR
jgi:hypothetical protein